MSALVDIVRSIAVEAAKEALQWAIDRARDKLAKRGIVADKAVEAMIAAELAALHIALVGVGDAFAPPDKPLGLDEPLMQGMQVEVISDKE